MNPVDAEQRGIADGDVVSYLQTTAASCKMKVFLTEGIVPGTVATQSGWTPDYTIEGNYQDAHAPDPQPHRRVHFADLHGVL